MTFQKLIAEHEAIESLAHALIRMSVGAPRPHAAAEMLEELSQLVRDHLAEEDAMIYAVVERANGGRHHSAAAMSAETFEALKEDWGQYLYRWDHQHLVDDWRRFGTETVAMLERLNERVAAETAVLYSLAVHHDLLAPGDSRPEPRPRH